MEQIFTNNAVCYYSLQKCQIFVTVKSQFTAYQKNIDEPLMHPYVHPCTHANTNNQHRVRPPE